MAGARSRWLGAAAFAWLATGCVEPGAARIVGPDGTQMLHVHCGGDQAACFQLAGDACPHGYYVSPIFDPHDGNFLVRCKPPVESVAVASTAQAPPITTAQATKPLASPDQPWPPAEVARPTEPWPRASSVAATMQSSIRDVDSGLGH